MLANSSNLKILAMASWNVLKAPKFYFNKTLTAKIGNTIEAEPTIVIREQNKVKSKTQKPINLYLQRWVHSGMTMTGALWPRTLLGPEFSKNGQLFSVNTFFINCKTRYW